MIQRGWWIVVPSAVLVSLATSRVIFSLRTGFMYPDEGFFYYLSYTFLQGQTRIISLQHPMFHLIVLAASIVLVLDNAYKFITAFAYLQAVVSILSVVLLKKILDEARGEKEQNKLIAFLLIFLPIFTGLTLVIITEPFTFFFFLLSFLYLIRFSKTKKVTHSLLAGITMMICCGLRPDYQFIYGMNFLFLIFLCFRSKSDWKGFLKAFVYVIPIFLVVSPPQLLGGVYFFGPSPLKYLVGLLSEREHTPLAHPPQSELLDPKDHLMRIPINLGLSLGLGWTPIFAVTLMMSLLMWLKITIRGKQNVDVFGFDVVLCFLLWASLIATISRQVPYALRHSWSALARYSARLLPCFLGISFLKKRLLRKVAVICILSSLALAPLYVLLSQTNLSIVFTDRFFSKDYAASWAWDKRQEYLDFVGGRSVVVVGHPLVRLTYFTDYELLRPLSHDQFAEVVKKYDVVLIYGEKNPEHYELLEQIYPWHFQLVNNQTEYKLRLIWNNPESYLYVVEK